MKISKNIKIKLFVLVAFLVLMFVQVGPYLLYADENEMTFSYQKLSMIATNEYYNSKNLFFAEAHIGQYSAYCLDYGIPLPVKSGGTVKYIRQLSEITTAGLVFGYPNVSVSSLGLNTAEEATIATQLAIWRLSQATGVNDSQKTNYILDMDNFMPTTGNEEVFARVKAAAQRIIDRALVEPYFANPTLNIINANSKITILENNKMLVGPYKIDGRGYNISSVKVALVDAPESAELCDVNGTVKTNFANQEDVYVKLDQDVGPVTFTLRVDQKGSHNVGKVYGTGNSSDGKQDYCILATLPDAITALADITLPELTGGIKIIKVDQDGNKLAGVTFELRDTSGKVLQTKNTDENGVIEFYNLKLGEYVVVETSPLEGYIMMDLPVQTEVKYNTINDLTIKNVKIKGGLKILKVGEDKTTPIAGVTFEILDSNKNVIDKVTTNTEGIAIATNLAAGTYYYREVSAVPEAHVVIDSTEHEFVISDPNVIEQRKIMNYYTRGHLTIHKITEDGKPIEGVVFDILDENKNLIDTITTDANGNAKTPKKLARGNYYYQEKSAPATAYVVVDTTMKPFSMEYTDNTIEVKNEYQRGKLRIYKTDEDGNSLADVVFDVLDENKNVVDTITTDTEGVATSKELVVGKYYFQEKSCKNPKVIIDENTYDFEITYEGEIVKEEVTNELRKMGRLKILKTGDDGRLLEGISFNILDENKKVIGTITTNEEGIALSEYLPLGNYYYKELPSDNNGIIIDENTYPFSIINDEEIVEEEVVNELIRGSLKIFKIDENGNFLNDVTFTLMNEKGKEIDKQTTTGKGIATFDGLLPGKYTFKEVDAPDIIVVDEKPQTIEITLEQLNIETTVKNYFVRGVLKIIKIDELGNKLEGIKFNILNEKKEVIETIVTNKDGIATSSELLYGTYYYKELPSDNNSIIVDENEYKFVLDSENLTVEEEVVNELKRGSLSIFKVDENGNYLEGVTFTLIDSKGNEIDRKTTGKDGIVKFENLLPGKYNFKEVDAPDIVVIDEKTQTIEITAEQLNVETTVKNYFARGVLKIIKTDELGNKLEGIKFNILNDKKEVIETIVTDKDGIATSSELMYGTYYYKELPSDNNSIIVDEKEYEFVINGENTLVEKTVVNKLKRGTLSIFKVDEAGNYVQNVTFTLINSEGKEIDKKTTGKDGIVKFENLLPGKYNFKEVEAPVYVVPDKEEKTIEITIDELNVKVTVENKFARGILKIHKTDMADNNLSGVTFEILDGNKKVLDTKTTDENGILESIKLPVGKYYYREVKAEDENIIIDTKLYEFAITENEEVVLKEVKNKTVEGVVIITKVDADNKNIVLAGAEIEILDANKNVLAKLTTDENGQVKLGKLKIGTYYYKETKAPEGYILNSKENEFTITKDAQVREITFKNEAKKLPQTGGFISTNMLIVIIVAIVSIVGYVTITIITSNKQNN